MSELLSLRRVTKRFGGLVAVSEVSLDIPRGIVTSVVGPNGAGKSTLFGCICGQIKSTSGTVFWGSDEITGLTPERVSLLGVARTFQTSRPIPHFSVLENVLVGADRFGDTNLFEDLLASRRRVREEVELRSRAQVALERVGLGALSAQPVETLSYGQRRLLEIARALAGDPKMILLDEPAAGLNSAEAGALGGLLRDLVGEGLGVMLVEHNLRLVLRVSDQVAVLDFGKLIAADRPDVVVRDQHVIDAYLGGRHGAA